MATVTYPDSLPKPLLEMSRAQSPSFRMVQPLTGPGYVKRVSTDAPVQYDLTWRMRRDAASMFMTWFYSETGAAAGANRFIIKLDTEFGLQDHTLQILPDSLMPMQQEAHNVFSYTASAICRKMPMPEAYRDHADLIVLDAFKYRSGIDVALNQVWPEPINA